MNMLLLIFIWYLFVACNPSADAYCPNDEDLQRHRCTCSQTHGYIQCSSLPNACRTCYRYNTLFFNEHVDILPAESFRFYHFFDKESNTSFTIQFAQVNLLSTNTFSKVEIDEGRTLSIKISKYTASLLPSRTFDEVTLQSRAQLDIEIFNVTSPLLTIEQYALDGIKYNHLGQFRLSILYLKDTLEFQSNAGSLLLPSFSRVELFFSNFRRVLFREHSFDHITQEHSSQLRINFDHFHDAILEHTSFFDLHQLDQSQFHLSLSNFEDVNIEQTLFDTITQLKSSLIFSIYNMGQDLCLPARMFSQIKQDMNSTFQFQVNYGQNILFTTHTFLNITQRAQSTLAIVVSNSMDVHFARQSIDSFHQDDRSLLDIWIKYGRNLIFEDHAIQNIDTWHSSLMRIGFQYSSGTLQMATNAFLNINQGQGGELLFQIMNSSDFYFRFNESIKLERLEILDRTLTDQDLCRIIDIPSHLPVKLLSEQPCFCAVFYLYRRLHHTLSPSMLRDLTPFCYSNMSLDLIEYQENQCSFTEHAHRCQQLQGQLDVLLPTDRCHRTVPSLISHHPHSASFLSFIIIFPCLIFTLTCVYVISSYKRRCVLSNLFHRFSFRSRRQKLPIFSADSYQQLTHSGEQSAHDDYDDVHLTSVSSKMMKIMVKYDSTTDQTQPYIHTNKSDFIVTNEDHCEEQQSQKKQEDVKLTVNTNPLDDMEHEQ